MLAWIAIVKLQLFLDMMYGFDDYICTVCSVVIKVL